MTPAGASSPAQTRTRRATTPWARSQPSPPRTSGRSVKQLLGPFAEHWNGTRWKIAAVPAGVGFLAGLAALSGGTVIALGHGTDNSGILLSNSPALHPSPQAP